MKNSRGFTLIELMVAVAIFAIIVTIAIPSIKEYMHKARRTDAKTLLTSLQIAQEKMRANCNVYAQKLDGANNKCVAGDAVNTELKFSSTSDGEWYSLAITGADDIGYVATATAAAAGFQSGDDDCQKFILTIDDTNPKGKRESKDKNGVDSTAQGCW